MNWILEIQLNYLDSLSNIREWDNLLTCKIDDKLFIKNCTLDQIKNSKIQKNPFLIIYEYKEDHLFRLNSIIPAKKFIDNYTWKPFIVTIPLELPNENFNFFGIHQKVSVQLKPMYKEIEAAVHKVSLSKLENYVLKAPDFRLKQLKWVVVDKEAFIFGTPMLPLEGTTYWNTKDFLFPLGYGLEYNFLIDPLKDMLNPHSDKYIVFTDTQSYIELNKEAIMPLSISSFKLTISNGRI